ncbi:MAG: hypothetical protein D6681_10955 [Calditrichaeota bacterium]|nr:MAG: hypothetical protein D6681_10955 [Calditrichota bacterium]
MLVVAQRKSRRSRECWMLVSGCWMLDAGCWFRDAGCWPAPAAGRGWSEAEIPMQSGMLDARCWMLDTRCSMLDAGLSRPQVGDAGLPRPWPRRNRWSYRKNFVAPLASLRGAVQSF